MAAPQPTPSMSAVMLRASRAPALNSGGTLNQIGGLLTVHGDAADGGSDDLNLDDTGDNSNNVGTVTATTVTGLGMIGSVAYDTVESLNVALGFNGDVLTVASTHQGVTSIDARDAPM